MKKSFLDPLARAAYEARKAALVTGAYPASAVRTPDETHFYAWEELPERVENAVQSLYRQQAEATLGKFITFVLAEGNSEVRQALTKILYELREKMLTDAEQAKMEEGV